MVAGNKSILVDEWAGNLYFQSVYSENMILYVGRTDAEAPIFWLPDVKSQLIRKDPDAGKARGQEEKGLVEDEIVRKHYQLNGHGSRR